MKIFMFEFRRLFSSRTKVFLIILFLMASLYFSGNGVSDYQHIIESKKNFLDIEQKLVGRYVNYEQYGGYGFRIFFEPSPLIIFFKNSSILKDIESNVNTLENYKIYSISEGSPIFNEGYYKDASGVFFIFASLYVLLMGFKNFVGESYVKYVVSAKYKIYSVVSRLLIIITTFLFLMVSNYVYIRLCGIKFSQLENSILIRISLHTLLFLSFFYGIGLLISLLIKSRVKSVSVALIIWFTLVFVIPELNRTDIINRSKSIPTREFLNLKKLETLMGMEREVEEKIQELKEQKKKEQVRPLQKQYARKYIDEIYEEIKGREIKYNKMNTSLINVQEQRSVLTPTSFYLHLAREASSKGYYGYEEFVNYNMEIREEFLKYYVKGRYFSKKPKIGVVSFVKNNENVFIASPIIPKSYWKGVVITALYALLFFVISFLILRRRLNRKKEIFKPDFEFEENGEMVYILCENEEYQEKIFNYYQEREDCICIDNVRGEDIDPGLSLNQTALYFCKLLNARVDRTFEHIEQLGIADIKTYPRTPEAIKKIYCATCMAVEKDIIVFKDFLNRESREFEVKFRQLLKDTMDMERNFIYIRTETPKIESEFNAPGSVDKYALIPMSDPREFIIR